MKAPEISLLIPVYNGGEYLHKLLDCLLQQSFKAFEAICVEDGSTDGSLELLEKYAECDDRIRLIRRTTKGGTAVAGLKYGLPYCKGRYFFFMSQDDLLDIDTLEVLYQRAEETGADAVIPDMVWYKSSTVDNQYIYPPEDNYELELTGIEAFKLSLPWHIHGFYLRKTALLREVGYDDSFLTGCECTSRKYLFFCKKVVFCHTLFYYRQDNDNAITKKFKPILIDDIYGYIILLHFMENHGIERSFIRKWHEYTATLFRLYRGLTEQNYSVLNDSDRLLAQKKLVHARNSFLIFSIRYGFFRNCIKVCRHSKIRLKRCNPTSSATFQDMPFKATCQVGRHSYSGKDLLVGNQMTSIGNFCSVADNVAIGPGEHPLAYLSTSPYFYQEALGWRPGISEVYCDPCHIGNDVWIGQGAFLRQGISVGDGAVIGASSVVLKDVPPYAIVAGVPAKVLRFRFDAGTIEILLSLRWWDLTDADIKKLPFRDIDECIRQLKLLRKPK